MLGIFAKGRLMAASKVGSGKIGLLERQMDCLCGAFPLPFRLAVPLTPLFVVNCQMK